MAKKGTTKYNPATVDRICAAIAVEGTDRAGWTEGGVSRSAFYRWLDDESKDFKDRVTAAREEFRAGQLPELRRKAKRVLAAELDKLGSQEITVKTVRNRETGEEVEHVTASPARIHFQAVQWALGNKQPDLIEWVAQGIELGVLSLEHLKIAEDGYKKATAGIKQAIADGLPKPDGAKGKPGEAIADALGIAARNSIALSKAVDRGSEPAKTVGQITADRR